MATHSHEVDFEIFGEDLQFVEIELDPGETVIAEAGAMLYMEQGITFEAKMGDGSEPDKGFLGKLGAGAKRVMSGESIFMTHFTNGGAGRQKVAFAAPYPGRIVAIDLDEVAGRLVCERDAFLCAALGTKVSVVFNPQAGRRDVRRRGFHPPTARR